jgi:hypothetical protein
MHGKKRIALSCTHDENVLPASVITKEAFPYKEFVAGRRNRSALKQALADREEAILDLVADPRLRLTTSLACFVF